MYRLTTILLLIIFNIAVYAQDGNYFQYISPKPGSKYISNQTTIIFRFKEKWHDLIEVSALNIKAYGTESGSHKGEIILSDDKKTYIFRPFQKFIPGEKVKVIIYDAYSEKSLIQYSFTTSAIIKKNFTSDIQYPVEEYDPQVTTYGKVTVFNGVSVPSDFPKFDIDIIEETAGGGDYTLKFGWMNRHSSSSFRRDPEANSLLFLMTDTTEAGSGEYTLDYSTQPKLLSRAGIEELGPFAIGMFKLPTNVLQNETIPAKFSLNQNFPNPFNPTTTMKYNLKKPGHVILKIYNLNGQEIETLVNGYHIAGEHKIVW